MKNDYTPTNSKLSVLAVLKRNKANSCYVLYKMSPACLNSRWLQSELIHLPAGCQRALCTDINSELSVDSLHAMLFGSRGDEVSLLPWR